MPKFTFEPHIAYYVKKFILITLFTAAGFAGFAQDSTASKKIIKKDKKEEKRRHNATLAKQAEEGVLIFTKQTAGGVELRTNGYGAFLEIGRARSPRWTNLYSLEISEIKNSKEEKASGDLFANSFVYGKINNFYQAKLGFGQQYVLGQKGNKNGVAVLGIVNGGLSLGLLKPYFIRNRSGNDIKYESKDSVIFLTPSEISGGSGFTKGWAEVKIKPGLFLKAALRFDFGRFNEGISALEIGASIDYYTAKIPILAYSDPKQIFFQGHIAFVFGKRK